MSITRLLSLPLQLAFAAAALCMTTSVHASSPAAVQEPDRSAIAQYQRILRPSSPLFGPGETQQSSAFLIDSGNDDAPALLVATAHAVDERPDIVAEQLAGRGAVIFEGVDGASFPVAKIRYTSQRGLDFAVLELQQTQGELKALGVVPLSLAGHKAVEGETVVVAARSSGSSLAIARWPVQELARLDAKTGHGFLQRHLLVMDGARVQLGDSGSPVLQQASGAVLAVVHSRTPRGGEASDLSFLPHCLDNGRFEPDASGCGLGNVFNLALQDDQRLIYKDGITPMVVGASLFSTTSLYQAKLAQWPEQCEEPSGYGAVQASGSSLVLPIEGFILAPHNPTVLALCVWGREASGPEAVNRNAVALPVVVHPPGPAEQPELDIGEPFKDRQGRNAYLVTVGPEQVQLRQVDVKSGPLKGIDCASRSGYVPLAGTRKVLVTEDTRLCAVGIDYAGQRSQPVEIQLRP